MAEIEDLVRENIRGLAPYSTARDDYDGPVGIQLDANESPFENGYNRYPDPHQKELKKLIARIKGVPEECIFIGNGSDEAIDLVFRVFCEPGRDNAVAITPTYSMYRVAAAVNDVAFREVPLSERFGFNASGLLEAADDRTKLAFLCSPNNPTGNLLDKDEVERFVGAFDGITVLDEAYIDFAPGGSFLPRLAEFPRLVILQTLSKAWGMAGLRLGLAFASPEITGYLSRVKYPYNINCVTQQIVSRQLAEGPEEGVRGLLDERGRLLRILPTLPVVREIYPTDANFVLVRVDNPGEVYRQLIDGGVIVRDRSSLHGCGGCLRITVGTPQENDKLIQLLGQL
ncbi:MAG: histidinol-phosphate transaminase [Alistipes sp.]|nr:histidinol-phosphate transaminase [Alistipes sp.]